MRKGIPFWLTLAFVAAALVGSAILLVDYVRPEPVFCDAMGACAKVRATVFARPFGIPLPAIGLSGMLAIALAALLPGRGARIAQLVFASVGALAAVGLFAVQARIRTFCPYCAVVDGSAIVLLGLSVLRFRSAADPPKGPRVFLVGLTGVLLAIGVPLVVGFGRRSLPTDLPTAIREEIRQTGSGKVTIVDFADFECPYCRKTHALLAPLVEHRKDKVRVVRKHIPLPMHPHALDAAKAGCCAENLGKGEAMAELLFTVPTKELTPEGCEDLAKRVGIDVDRFRSCVNDPATVARLEKDRDVFVAAQGRGLPTLFIDGTRLVGDQEPKALEQTLDAAIRAL